MQALRIGPALDEFKHRQLRLRLRPEALPLEQFAFQRGEEALAQRGVKAIP